MKAMHLWIIGLALSLFFLSTKQILATEADNLFQDLQSTNYKSRVDALKLIERNGVVTEPITHLLEKRLQDTINKSGLNSKQVDEIAWTCKAFASSGNPAAKTLLFQVGKSGGSTQAKHCKGAADRLTHYSKRHEVLSAEPSIAGLNLELSRAINLLEHGDFDMQREGAKRVIRSKTTDKRVFDLVRDSLLKGAVSMEERDRVAVDACGWMSKCLVESGNKEYISALQQVEKTTAAWKVKEYAGKAAKQLGGE